MKKLLILAGAVLVCAGLQSFVNCSDPLETTGSRPVPPIIDTVFNTDTVEVVDTIPVIDTVIVTDSIPVTDTVTIIDSIPIIDTIIVIDTVPSIDTVVIIDSVPVIDTVTIIDSIPVIDTVIIIDTLIDVDTLIVVVPDSTEFRMVCGQLSSTRQELVWLFRNLEGTYHLEFAASTESNQPIQTLTIDINGDFYEWQPAEDPEFIIDHYLSRNATIRIIPQKPPARGHEINVCVTISMP